MEIIYSTQRTGFEKTKAYANPRFFQYVDTRCTKAIVIGDWPNVVAAYEAKGIPVQNIEYGLPLKTKQQIIEQGGALAKPIAESSIVEIPDDWSTLHWKKRKKLAESLTNQIVINGEEADFLIKSELGRRNGDNS